MNTACLSFRSGLLLLLFVSVAWLAIRWFEWKQLYFPSREITFRPSHCGLDYEDVTFVSEDDARLHGWWIPFNGNASYESARGTIIMCHGNGGNISDRVDSAANLHSLGFNIFLFDYRGYGRSKGLSTERGLYRDARAAYEVVRSKLDHPDHPRIIAYGRSLGGGVATQLALDKPVDAVILENTFTSIPDMARKMYPGIPLHLICRDRYDNKKKMAHLTVPLLIAHSPEDTLIPFDMSQELLALAPPNTLFCELRGNHNEAGWQTAPAYWNELQAFLNRVAPPVDVDPTRTTAPGH
jgi:hypothetical protein